MMLVSRRASDGDRGPLSQDVGRTAIIIALLTIALYMSFLIDLKVITIFKRRTTLYFWSLLVASWGIISHSVGVLLKWFVSSCPWVVYTAFSSFGWWAMVTGQSLVLYSRLHLVVRNERVLRAILIMITVNFCVFQIPTTVLKFICTAINTEAWLKVFQIYERIQLAIFTLQELIISCVYIRAAVVWLSPSDPEGTRRTKYFLVYLNLLCIALDVAIVCEVYRGDWEYEEATQSLAYAIKLTLEFAVLNKVLEVHRFGPRNFATCRCNLVPGSPHHLIWGGVGPTSRNFSPITGLERTSHGRRWSRRTARNIERFGPFRGKRRREKSILEEQTELSTPSTGPLRKDLSKGNGTTVIVRKQSESRDSIPENHIESP